MKSFTHLDEISVQARSSEHGGVGSIGFRRLWFGAELGSPIDFVDFTVIPPRSTIGRHKHEGNEELYYIASGAPLVKVESEMRRLRRGDTTVVRSGQSHELINDTNGDVEIVVIQVRLATLNKAE